MRTVHQTLGSGAGACMKSALAHRFMHPDQLLDPFQCFVRAYARLHAHTRACVHVYVHAHARKRAYGHVSMHPGHYFGPENHPPEGGFLDPVLGSLREPQKSGPGTPQNMAPKPLFRTPVLGPKTGSKTMVFEPKTMVLGSETPVLGQNSWKSVVKPLKTWVEPHVLAKLPGGRL